MASFFYLNIVLQLPLDFKNENKSFSFFLFTYLTNKNRFLLKNAFGFFLKGAKTIFFVKIYML
ncbi:hypothetical protein DP065_01535 [[Mycoplasma] anseris]|uniref:Uncharacterized protein n=1 Tax=[Mycoplasma] anseris TaxID=92400 RepID=A0A2Z4NCX8_9BACT|nr:hypothetical protein DP065_01535 [[Mycoplasma] anseris]